MISFEQLVNFVNEYNPQTPTASHREASTNGSKTELNGKHEPISENRKKAYGNQVMSSAVDRISSSQKDTNRNVTLNSEAYQIYQLVAGGVIDGFYADEELFRAGISVGLEADEVNKTLDSAKQAGFKCPRSIPDFSTNGSDSNPPAGEGNAIAQEIQGFTRSKIRINDPKIRRKDVVVQVLQLLDRSNRVFLNNDNLVTVRHKEDQTGDSYLCLDKITVDTIDTFAEEVADFIRVSADENAPSKLLEIPPDWLCRNLVKNPCKYEHLRTINTITSFPILLPNDGILKESGYNEEFKIWYEPTRERTRSIYDIEPSKENAIEARDRLLELICDFPFEFEESKATWLSMLLTMQARQAIRGSAPLFVLDAPSEGPGKTMLCNIAMLIATGQTWPVCDLPFDEAEQRKSLITYLIESRPVVFFDNMKGLIQGKAIEAALTSNKFTGRLLGSNKSITARVETTWILNGNNLSYSGDIMRRSVPIRLAEKDGGSTNYKHEDLLGYVRENQEELQNCGLTILRAWVAANKPLRPGNLLPSFEEWHRMMGGICLLLDLPDPLQSKEKQIPESEERQRWNELIPLLAEILDGKALSSFDLKKRIDGFAQENYEEDSQDRLKQSILSFLPNNVQWQHMKPQQLSNVLRKGIGRTFEGLKLCSKVGHRKTVRWYCEHIHTNGTKVDGDRDREPEPEQDRDSAGEEEPINV